MNALGGTLWGVGALGWTVAVPVVMSGSTGIIPLVAWVTGEGLLAGLVWFLRQVPGATWTPSQSARSAPRDYAAEHQQHLWEQARAAYLTNPGSQRPPPTDNFPGGF